MKSINARYALDPAIIRRAWKAGLVLLVLCIGALLLTSCGGGGQGMQPPPTPQAQGSVVVFAGDAPLCDVMSLSMTIAGMTLTPAGGGSPVSLISSANPVSVDFASLMGTSMMLGSSSVPAGSYSQVMLTLSNPQMGMLNSGSNGMGYGMMNSTIANSSVTVNLNPPLEVQAGSSVGMMLDMSLLKSLQTGSSGAVTGTINPVFQGSVMSGGQGGAMMQRLGGLGGIVQTVSTSSSNSAFSGSFTLEQWMAGRSFTVNVTGQTSFQGVSGLAALTSGTFVEIQGSVDANGNLVASQVDAEGQPDSQRSLGAFMGMVTAVTRDSYGNVTGFQFGMNQEFPDMHTMMGILSQPDVTLAPQVDFQIEAPSANLAHLSLDATALGPGQFLTVNGQVAAASGTGMMGGGMGGAGNGSLVADSVVLREQPLVGTFNRVLAAGADGKSGGFTMTPCSSVFGSGNAPIPVLTSSQTSFGSLSGLSGMTANSQIVLNGLLFYEPTLTQANGVQLSPPGWVFEATQVGLPQ